ncbi:hypothetical protein CYLTODRAFT_342602 [Cylindrobasidium torrendii FP15055 ss-10]|uniref:Uncharacterized protein n=1 Tax=Cylindrobasidium torrendii FP15055 ss-10 TaxID=1314674 RepID=A0A0D7BSP5_9AGAR|nr:hypothetical protein CYLTODRAFT_342602 [Cylindrobasidium torrendii FP15055 ss-10]
MTTTILFSAFAPFSTLSLAVPSETPISTLLSCLGDKYTSLPTDSLRLASHSGLLDDTAPISSLDPTQSSFVALRLTTPLLGGKGGFGSQLRAAGGRMSSQKTSNNDSCRDLNGRRLSTIKEAKKLAEYLESEPERQAAKADAQKAKLQALERKLGIDPKTGAPAPLAGTKHKFEDNEYLEESKELVDSVRSAVSAGTMCVKLP